MSDMRQVTQRDHRRVLPDSRTTVMAFMCLMAGTAAAFSPSQEP